MKQLVITFSILLSIVLVLSCEKKIIYPVILTDDFREISYTTATSGGIVTNEGSAAVIRKGLCWSTIPEPIVSDTDSMTTDGTGLGPFLSHISGLSPNTLYYVRAYAENNTSFTYGDQKTFTTLQIEVPVLITSDITSITRTTAISGGHISSDGGETVTSRGICFSREPTPTIADSTIIATDTTSTFTVNIIGLTANTTYFIRAFASNNVGTAYGNESSFTTSGLLIPVISNFNSIIKNFGDADFYLTPPVSTSNGLFTYSSSNKEVAIIYFGTKLVVIKASGTTVITATQKATSDYASASIAATLTVNPIIPTVSTAFITFASNSGGNVTSDGGASVTSRGICWSTFINPTVENDKTIDGEGQGAFVSSLKDLDPNTIYYIRAYASNIAGTGYGSNISYPVGITFNPKLTYGEEVDIDGNIYKTILIGSQTWMAENLKTSTYNDGISIPQMTNPDDWGNQQSPLYCWYENRQSNKTAYGALYNWYAVSTGKLCPTGWHVPSNGELGVFLGRVDIHETGGFFTYYGIHSRETGIGHWSSEKVFDPLGTMAKVDNSSGLTLLPGGRNLNGTFTGLHSFGYWWSATEKWPGDAYYVGLNVSGQIENDIQSENQGLSVRCVKD